ncbi:MAG: 2-oxoacid:acceptor oxidoreductase family protein [Clostridiales bacterium]|nr:2-oxoacid:acceptor oxidoreductase family protein [Peptococcus niger]MDU7243935.1 2-oxoacid:acceptor oxidoreductase family protein [Clostridiales bacterium]
MEERILCAGFGGQGVMAIGQMLTYGGMVDNYECSYLPSYGPEMRGGAANCSVILSDKPVGSPNVTAPRTLIAMNKPSLEKFAKTVVPGGVIFVNSSLIDTKVDRDDVKVFYVPVTDIARNDVGNAKASNMVMFGAYLGYSKLLSDEAVKDAYMHVFGERKAKFFDMNRKAMDAGMKLVEEQHAEMEGAQ